MVVLLASHSGKSSRVEYQHSTDRPSDPSASGFPALAVEGIQESGGR